MSTNKKKEKASPTAYKPIDTASVNAAATKAAA